jgi:antitoxin (DNA-binding transcriptional repressor) of toxin-antitoxin stability system
MGNRMIHISDAEAASEFASLLDRVRAGAEVVIEHDARPIVVLRPAASAAPEGARNGAERDRLELQWLALNRQRYSGRWVALEGDELLAVGDSAREVYAAVASHEGVPLVTHVEPASLAAYQRYVALVQSLAAKLTLLFAPLARLTMN